MRQYLSLYVETKYRSSIIIFLFIDHHFYGPVEDYYGLNKERNVKKYSLMRICDSFILKQAVCFSEMEARG